MSDKYVKKWLTKASNDLKVAEHVLASPKDEVITDAVCFHAQQAAEKFLKAYLVTRNVDFGKTHNLEFLVELCAKVDNEFNDVDVGNLTFYAVEVRYPDEFYTPTIEEAQNSIKIAKKIEAFILDKLKLKREDIF